MEFLTWHNFLQCCVREKTQPNYDFFLPVFCHCRVEVSHSCRACSSSQHSQRWSHHPGNIQWHLDFLLEILLWQYFSYFIPRQRGTSPLYLHWVLKQTNGKWTGKKSDIRDLDPLSHFTLQSTPFHPAIRPRSSWLGKRNGLMVGVKSSIFSSFYPFVLCMHGGEMFPLSRPLAQLQPRPSCWRGERCTRQRLSGIIYCYWLHPDDLCLAGRTSWWSTSWAGASMATCTRPSGRGTTSPSPSRHSG